MKAFWIWTISSILSKRCSFQFMEELHLSFSPETSEEIEVKFLLGWNKAEGRRLFLSRSAARFGFGLLLLGL